MCVGPAGTGKTWGILHVLHCLARDNPGLRLLIGRATRAALTESVLVTYEQEILPLDGMEWIAAGVQRRVRQSYQYPSGSELVLGGLDNSVRILSTAWDIVYINEAIEVTKEAWETLASRLSRPGRTSRLGYLIGDTNPGDPSHWIRDRIDRDGHLTEWVTPHQANPAMFDGCEWTEAGQRYLDSLQRLTGTRRKRLLHGLWAAGDAAWFSGFDVERNVSTLAEYDPYYPVHLAADNNGLHTGAVWFQVRPGDDGPLVSVFGDYYNPAGHIEGYRKALEIIALGERLCGGRYDFGTHDPAAGARLGFNVTISGEYERAGLKLNPWPTYPGSVVAGLTLVESFLAGGLIVHPRCQHLIAAMTNYRRKQRNGQYIDEPESPMHPHEDLIDALRGGLLAHFPEGRRPAPKLTNVRAGRVF